MTGTWRDSLFLWQGRLTRVSSGSAGNGDSLSSTASSGDVSVHWEGSWIGIENCPDSRCVPTPTSEAFAASSMKFQVSGTGNFEELDNGNCLYWTLEMNEGGWDLGDGADKRRRKDHTHTLYMEIFPDANVAVSEKRNVVVGMGVNDYGPFVSAGYILSHSSDVIMARRYLDERDRRTKLTIEDLYDSVIKADHGTYCLGSYVMWANRKARRRTAPWRTLDLHAECLNGRSGKRKRVEEGQDRLEALPLLYIPTDGFSPAVTIDTVPTVVNTDTSGSSSRLQTHVKWLEQCNGCGHEIGDRTKACCKEVVEYTPTGHQTSQAMPVGWAFYCSEQCAQRHGSQAWADAGRQWAEAMAGTGNFLKSNGASGFWYAVQNDKAAMIVLLAAGWRKDFMDYILDSSSMVVEPTDAASATAATTDDMQS